VCESALIFTHLNARKEGGISMIRDSMWIAGGKKGRLSPGLMMILTIKND
jgi:hypothetical protein